MTRVEQGSIYDLRSRSRGHAWVDENRAVTGTFSLCPPIHAWEIIKFGRRDQRHGSDLRMTLAQAPALSDEVLERQRQAKIEQARRHREAGTTVQHYGHRPSQERSEKYNRWCQRMTDEMNAAGISDLTPLRYAQRKSQLRTADNQSVKPRAVEPTTPGPSQGRDSPRYVSG